MYILCMPLAQISSIVSRFIGDSHSHFKHLHMILRVEKKDLQICSNKVQHTCVLHVYGRPNMCGDNINQSNSLTLCAKEQRQNRPETIRRREETHPPVRDIYIIEKDFEGKGENCVAETRLHTEACVLPCWTRQIMISPLYLSFFQALRISLPPTHLPLHHISLSSIKCARGIIQITVYIFTNGSIPTQLHDVSHRITN